MGNYKYLRTNSIAKAKTDTPEKDVWYSSPERAHRQIILKGNNGYIREDGTMAFTGIWFWVDGGYAT